MPNPVTGNNPVLSWAGIQLCLDSEQFHQWIDPYLPIQDVQAMLDLPHNPLDQPGLTIPRMRRPKPTPKLNQFYYPVGASQWAEGYFLLDEIGYQQYLQLLTPVSMNGNPPTAFPFIMSDGINTITTNLYALPVRPFFGLTPGFYLLPLVDERYLWQFQGGATQINTTGSGTFTSWATLFSNIASILDITLTTDSIASAYLVPCPYSCLDTTWGNLPLLLDACAYNVGQHVVRNYDGTYRTMNFTTSNTAAYTNYNTQMAAGGQSAGNLMFVPSPGSTNPQPGPQLNMFLPSQIYVYFPKKLNASSTGVVGQGAFINPRSNRLPYGLTAGDYYSYQVNLNAQPFYNAVGATGNGGWKVVVDTCPALFTTPAQQPPENNTDLQNLSQQIALDLWGWDWSGFHVTYAGVANWTPEGSHDLIFNYSEGRTNYAKTEGKAYQLTTTVRRLPYNFDKVDMLHWESGVQIVQSVQASATFNPVVGFQCINGQMEYEQITVSGNFTITNSP